MSGYASHILGTYLREIGMARPEDGAQQYQIALLRQWTCHLEHVLREEGVPGPQAERIIRVFLYGAVPQYAEAQMRQEISQDLVDALQRIPPGSSLDLDLGLPPGTE